MLDEKGLLDERMTRIDTPTRRADGGLCFPASGRGEKQPKA
jgi:hypothetical protein